MAQECKKCACIGSDPQGLLGLSENIVDGSPLGPYDKENTNLDTANLVNFPTLSLRRHVIYRKLLKFSEP